MGFFHQSPSSTLIPVTTPTNPEISRLSWTFWYLVIIFNIALLTLSLGILLLLFETNWPLGLPLIVTGIVTFTIGYYRYRHHRYQNPS